MYIEYPNHPLDIKLSKAEFQDSPLFSEYDRDHTKYLKAVISRRHKVKTVRAARDTERLKESKLKDVAYQTSKKQAEEKHDKLLTSIEEWVTNNPDKVDEDWLFANTLIGVRQAEWFVKGYNLARTTIAKETRCQK